MRVLALSALWLPLGVYLAACSSSVSADSAYAGGRAGGPSVAGQTNDVEQPMHLKFETVEVLPARAQILLKVQATPAKSYRVHFALPTSGGDPLDAVLDQATADADVNGLVGVLLTAPSRPTTFDVRASAGNVSATVTVTVKDPGTASLQVQPIYPSNLRVITTWVASAYPNKTCAELPDIPTDDEAACSPKPCAAGPLTSLPAASDAAPRLKDVPARTPLAITLRSGHFVGGCTSIESLAPGPVDQPQLVQVTVLDRPIDLSVSPLDVTFGLPTPATPWSGLLQSAGDAVLLAQRGSSVDDVDTLLDAMREASGSSRQLFESARSAENWDGLVRMQWGASAASKLHDLSAAWLAAGRQRFLASERLFTGSLRPIAQPDSPLDQRSADFTLLSVAGLDGKHSGFVDRAQVAWSASSDDTLLLGTDLYLVESQLAANLAEAAALAAQDDATTAPELLAQALDCAGLGAALALAGPSPELAYDECEADCLVALCENGVSAIWLRGDAATGLSPTRVSISATGVARVGDAAEVVGVGGTWLGALATDDGTAGKPGVLTAVAPAVE